MSPFRLDNKTAVVTGAGSGIGRSIAEVFAQNGATVHVVDINLDAAKEAVDAIRKNGGISSAHCCDVTNQEAMIALFNKINAANPIHILVNNAGVGFVGNLEKTKEEDFDRLYQINIKGVYNGLFGCIPHLKANGGGVILNMASVAATIALPDRFAYAMTKGAVVSMTYSVAIDYLKENIRCNCLSPARVHTPFVDAYLQKNYPGSEKEMFDKLSQTQPIGRMAQPEEIAQFALYLCSDASGFITGTDYPIDGGFIKLQSR